MQCKRLVFIFQNYLGSYNCLLGFTVLPTDRQKFSIEQ